MQRLEKKNVHPRITTGKTIMLLWTLHCAKRKVDVSSPVLRNVVSQGDAENGGWTCVEDGAHGTMLPAQCHCEPNTALKNKVYSFFESSKEKYDLEKILRAKNIQNMWCIVNWKTNIKATYSRILFVFKEEYIFIYYILLETAQKTLKYWSWLSLSGGIHTIFMFFFVSSCYFPNFYNKTVL